MLREGERQRDRDRWREEGGERVSRRRERAREKGGRREKKENKGRTGSTAGRKRTKYLLNVIISDHL